MSACTNKHITNDMRSCLKMVKESNYQSLWRVILGKTKFLKIELNCLLSRISSASSCFYFETSTVFLSSFRCLFCFILWKDIYFKIYYKPFLVGLCSEVNFKICIHKLLVKTSFINYISWFYISIFLQMFDWLESFTQRNNLLRVIFLEFLIIDLRITLLCRVLSEIFLKGNLKN